MAFKVRTFLTNLSADPSKWKGSVVANLAKHGRDFIEGVAAWGGRHGAAVKWQIGSAKVEPVLQLAKPSVSAVSGVCRIRKPAILLKNIANGIFLRSHPETLVSRFAQKVTPHPYWSTFRTHEQFRSIGRRLAAYSFVGISFAASSQSQLWSCDDGAADFIEVCSDIKKMFSGKLVSRACGVDDNTMWHAKLDDLEFGELVITSGQAAVFEAKLQPDALTAKLCHATDHESSLTGVISEPDLDLSVICEQKEENMVTPDVSLIENEVNLAVEIVDHHQKQLSDIFQLVCDHNRRLSNLCNVYDESVQKHSTGFSEDSDSSCSIEIIEDWQESFVRSIDVEHDAENYSYDDSEDDDVIDSVIELNEAITMMKEQELQLTELLRIALDQKQRFENLAKTSYDVAVKVIWMTDCSVDYATQVLTNELLPANKASGTGFDVSGNVWRLPFHFNIAPVVGGFLTTVQDVKLACANRHELPVVYNWQQDLAVCIIMKRYEFTLAEFLASHDVGLSDSLMLLLQLLEAVVHLSNSGVCHRNLKSDNIYVELLADGPHLMIGNFGSCFRYGTHFGFRTTCSTDELNKCSHSYLLAPELLAARSSSSKNYSKTDLWSCGAIAYEIFGCANPFRQTRSGRRLSNSRYQDSDLPNLPGSVPLLINTIVRLMLQRDPAKRPNPELAANALHIFLWAPEQWRLSIPSGCEIRRWLTQFAAVTYCSEFVHQKINERSPLVVDALKVQFLSRADQSAITEAVHLLCSISGNET